MKINKYMGKYALGLFLSWFVLSVFSSVNVSAEATKPHLTHAQSRILHTSDKILSQKKMAVPQQTLPKTKTQAKVSAVKKAETHTEKISHVSTKPSSPNYMNHSEIAQKPESMDVVISSQKSTAQATAKKWPFNQENEIFIEPKAPVENMKHIVIPSSR